MSRVLVACEESQVVTCAFRAAGHEAFSADIQECSGGHPEWHIQGDVLEHLNDGWDLAIMHPECKFLCLSSARWLYDKERYPDRKQDFDKAVHFFLRLQNARIPRICIENSQPLGRTIHRVGRYDQVVQPWMWGDAYTKGAYLWLQGLNPLIPEYRESDYDFIEPACHMEAPGPERSKNRAKTYPGIANAMARQWGNGEIPEFKEGLFA